MINNKNNRSPNASYSFRGSRTRFKRQCNHPMCRKLVYGNYCEDHQPKETHRASSSTRGYDAEWRRYRLWFLSVHPLCVECLKDGRTTSATVVDHIKDHRGDYELFWDNDNHQALCESCHNRKTARTDHVAWDTFKGLR